MIEVTVEPTKVEDVIVAEVEAEMAEEPLEIPAVQEPKAVFEIVPNYFLVKGMFFEFASPGNMVKNINSGKIIFTGKSEKKKDKNTTRDRKF